MSKADGQFDQSAVNPEQLHLGGRRGCPPQEQLEQFVLGKLPETELSQIGEHTDQCPQCQSMLTTLDEKQDELLARLRRNRAVDVEETLAEAISNECSDRRPDNEPTVAENENTDRIDKLLARMEQQKTSPVDRDWMQWARLTFGATRSDERTLVGGCRLARVLGVGGMGIVFAAHDDQLQRAVAIKVMRPERLSDTTARQRFLREARAIAAIQHEHIVPVFQVGEEQNVPYFVMPLLRGCSLEERLNDTERIDLRELLTVSIQIADGIAGAHGHGLIHRDIKPSNVWVETTEVRHPNSKPPVSQNAMASGSTIDEHTESEVLRTSESFIRCEQGDCSQSINPDDAAALTLPCSPINVSLAESTVGDSSESNACAFRPSNPQLSVKLLDFGLARAQLDDGRDPLSEDGMIMGTPAYMSPEQASGGNVDQRSDLFSLGCVMFRMATGTLPFPGRTVTQQLTALIKDSAKPLRELNDELPEELEDLVHQLLERDSKLRPSSAIEVRDRLQDLLDQVEKDFAGDGRSLKRRKPRRKPHATSQTRRVITVCCVMLCALIGTWFVVSRYRPEIDQSVTKQTTNLIEPPYESLAELLAQLKLEQEWYDRVSSLPAIVRAEEVKAELKRRNPDIGDAVQFELLSDRVRALTIDTTALRDIAPLVALRELQTVKILNSKTREPLELTDLRPLRDLPLKDVLIENCPHLAGYESLIGKELTRVSFYGSPLPDSQWFAQQRKIETLNLGGRATPIDLTMLKHLPLVGLELNETPVKDLSPLSHHRLEMLRFANSQISDLSPVEQMPLVRMDLRVTPITDFTPLQKLKHLTFVMLDLRSEEQIAVLKSLKSLRLCNQIPMTDIGDALLSPTTASRSIKPAAAFEPIEPWLQRVSDLPVQSLMAEVQSELGRRNPGLEKTLSFLIHDSKIFRASFGDGPVSDISPLAALKDLEQLKIGYRSPSLPGRELTDLRPLSGLKNLKEVELEFCPNLRDLSPLFDKPLLALSLYATPLPELNWIAGSNIRALNLGGRDSPPDLQLLKQNSLVKLELNETPISDLAPLAKQPLQFLSIAATNVTDLKPLQRMPLAVLDIQMPHALDLSPLKSIPTLRHLRCRIHDREQLAFIQTLTWLETVNRFAMNTLENEYASLPQKTPASVIERSKFVVEQQQQSQAAHRQLAQKVHDELIQRNPGYNDRLRYDARDDRIVGWEINSSVLEDISPLAQLPDLESIYFWNAGQLPRNLSDLSPLRGKRLKHVTLLRFPKLKDFSALADMPLESLGLYETPLPDIKWLGTLKLKELRIGGRTEAVDLSFVKQMPLIKLGLQEAPFSDLRPLSGLKLEEIVITNTHVRDLSPLKEMPLKSLKCEACPLDDFKQILAFKQLQQIECTIRTASDINVLRTLPDLTEINHRPANEVLR